MADYKACHRKYGFIDLIPKPTFITMCHR